jgi:hypothetical protein
LLAWAKSWIAKSVERPILLLDAGALATTEQLWPKSDDGHPWSRLYDDEEKRKIGAQMSERVKRVSEAPDSIRECRSWLVESAIARAEYEVIVLGPPPDRISWPFADYPGISGQLSPHLDAILQLHLEDNSPIPLAHEAIAEDPSLLEKFGTDAIVARELVATRINRGKLEMHVANALRMVLHDHAPSPKGDWLMPMLASLWSYYEDRHRRALGLPELITGWDGLSHGTFVNFVQNGTIDPLAEWRKTRIGNIS